MKENPVSFTSMCFIYSQAWATSYISPESCTSSQMGKKLVFHFQNDVFVLGFVDGDNGFENMIKRSLFLIVFVLLFYCRSSTISRKASL